MDRQIDKRKDSQTDGQTAPEPSRGDQNAEETSVNEFTNKPEVCDARQQTNGGEAKS